MKTHGAFLAAIAGLLLTAGFSRRCEAWMVTAVGGTVVGYGSFATSSESAPFVPLPEPNGAPPQTSEMSPQVENGSSSGAVGLSGPTAGRSETRSASEQGAPGSGLPSESKQRGPSRFGLWQIIKAGGTVGFVIILLSLVGGALAVEQVLTLRRQVLIPKEVVEKVTQQLKLRDIKGVLETCSANPSVWTAVLKAGIAEWENGWHEVEKALADALTEQTARLLRRVEYLSVIGNLAPMLGLLGTVVGMILAFRTVAETQGAARAADLAEAIYLALVTTVEGLLVAIPALGAYAFFRNRVDELMAEVAVTAQQVLAPLRRRRPATRPPVSPSASSQSEPIH